MKVLIVDDSRTMRMMVAHTLAPLGTFEVVHAEDGLQGLERLAPDVGLIITDWNMPNLSGLEFVEQLRARMTSVPVVMLTTNPTDADRAKAAAAGVNRYVTKPFNADHLRTTVRELLG